MKNLIIILFILISLTVEAQTIDQTQRAIVMPKNITSIIDSEKKLSENYTTPVPKDSSWFEYRTGTKNILIIAGHATAHTREDNIKRADGGTGSMAIELNRKMNVPVFFTKYLAPSDPNYYDDNAFKDSLAIILEQLKPEIVIDLHCSHPYRPFDIDFGTMNGKSYLNREDLLESLKLALNNEGLNNQSQDYFAAAKSQTVTKFVHSMGIPCIQLEINANYISADMGNVNGQNTAKLLQALIRFVDRF